jgi:general secretion pathway protein A
MHSDDYHFSEEPFALGPDPKFLFMARSHSEVFSAMVSGVKEKKGLIVITGEDGIGKTTLIYALLRDLRDKIKIAFISTPILDFKNMLETILQELGVPLKESQKDIGYLLIQFRKYLNQSCNRGEVVTVIIDEAQRLNVEALESLCRLTDPDTPAAKSLQILLVGQPELCWMLNSEKLEAINRKVGVFEQIKPMTREEGKEYIRHRLQFVGRDISEVFTPGAVKRIWKHAKGIPRVMNVISDRALSIGHEKSRPIIDSKIVKEAMADLKDHEKAKMEESPSANSRKGFYFMATKAVIFMLSLGLFFLFLEGFHPK